MDFTITHSRDIIGNKINVKITSDRNSLIVSVSMTHDGSQLCTDILGSPSTYFQKQMNQVGGAGPGYNHTLVVEVTDHTGVTESATETWQDDH
jgi:hypothetical protein